MPPGYQRLGRVLLLRLPGTLRPHFAEIGRAWQEELGVETVLTVTGPVEGELRTPNVERIAGQITETEVMEHGIRWRFDAGRIMFAAGNRTERVRAGRLVRPGETVIDLFAGIGYFTIPAARVGRAARVVAVEKNPTAAEYLAINVRRNQVEERVETLVGDNREVSLPVHVADRVFLGYLPSAVPWVEVALPTLRRDGGWLHVHTATDSREACDRARQEVVAAITDAGGRVASDPSAREVKPFGPGRTHVVVDAFARRP
jgi:tRNA wybutosine-synthesizing protein 2